MVQLHIHILIATKPYTPLAAYLPIIQRVLHYTASNVVFAVASLNAEVVDSEVASMVALKEACSFPHRVAV